MQQCPLTADYVQGLVKDAKVSQGAGKGAGQVDPGESLMAPRQSFWERLHSSGPPLAFSVRHAPLGQGLDPNPATVKEARDEGCAFLQGCTFVSKQGA